MFLRAVALLACLFVASDAQLEGLRCKCKALRKASLPAVKQAQASVAQATSTFDCQPPGAKCSADIAAAGANLAVAAKALKPKLGEIDDSAPEFGSQLGCKCKNLRKAAQPVLTAAIAQLSQAAVSCQPTSANSTANDQCTAALSSAKTDIDAVQSALQRF